MSLKAGLCQGPRNPRHRETEEQPGSHLPLTELIHSEKQDCK